MTLSQHLRSRRLSVLAIAVIASSVAGCGSSSSPPPSPVSSVSASTNSSSGSPPAETDSPAAIPGKTDAPVPVESNPPGDIPDNVAFVTYVNKGGRYSFTHPEGWAQTGVGVEVRFTDKLNGVEVSSGPAAQAPTVSSARSVDVARLTKSVPAFQLRDISAVSVPGGRGVRIVYRRNSDPDGVTGKVYRDEVEEYLVFRSGRVVKMDLYGPVGADNVDAYRTMSHSLSIQ